MGVCSDVWKYYFLLEFIKVLFSPLFTLDYLYFTVTIVLSFPNIRLFSYYRETFLSLKHVLVDSSTTQTFDFVTQALFMTRDFSIFQWIRFLEKLFYCRKKTFQPQEPQKPRRFLFFCLFVCLFRSSITVTSLAFSCFLLGSISCSFLFLVKVFLFL